MHFAHCLYGRIDIKSNELPWYPCVHDVQQHWLRKLHQLRSERLYRSEAFRPLIKQAPVPLIQGYFICVLTIPDAILRAIGIAAGSASLYSGVVLNILLVAAIYYYNRTHSDEQIINPAMKKEIIENEVKALNEKMKILMEDYQKRLNEPATYTPVKLFQ